MQGEKYQIQGKLGSHYWNCQIIQSDHEIWTKEDGDSELREVFMAANYVVFIYVIILLVGRSI